MSRAAPQEGTPLESGGTPAAAPARSGFFGLLMWLGLAVAVGIGLTAGFLYLRQETAARARIQARAEAAGLVVHFSSHSECPAWLRQRGPVAVQQWLGKHWLPFWERVDVIRIGQKTVVASADDVLGNDLKAFHSLDQVELSMVRVTAKELAALAPRVSQLTLRHCDVLSHHASALSEPPVLASLSLQGCRIDPGSLDSLMQAESLHEVDFRLDRQMTHRALEMLAASKHLTTLRIAQSNMEALRTSNVSEPFAALQTLRIENSFLDELSLSPFAGAPALHTIDLERTVDRRNKVRLVVARLPALQSLSAHRASVVSVELVDTPKLAFLELNHIRLAEDAFEKSSGWESVETLKVPHSGINDEMLAQVARMPRLRHLDLRHFRDEIYSRRRGFTVAGLDVLAGVKTLESLEMDRTVMKSERSTVRKALPGVDMLGDTSD